MTLNDGARSVLEDVTAMRPSTEPNSPRRGHGASTSGDHPSGACGDCKNNSHPNMMMMMMLSAASNVTCDATDGLLHVTRIRGVLHHTHLSGESS